MNFENYMKKIQYISNLLEKSKCPEDVLNSKEIDIIQDFQYICLNSSSNYNLVNDIIARLAQNGNDNVVKQNLKIISMSMWKELFDKNNSIKKIFIENYAKIMKDTNILTIREIERFINDNETCELIYSTLSTIIKKLCTYDRASLIAILKNKENGIEKIKENLAVFFQKGEFDISTTYSKILFELNQIPEISKLEILYACNNNLIHMLNRETAVDNETNKLLNWIYEAYEEATMTNEQKAIFKKSIDNALKENFEYILDKSNYDKNTIKSLKQFDCTKELFEKNKGNQPEELNRKIEEQKIYSFNINDEKNHIKEVEIDSKKVEKVLEEATEKISKEDIILENIIIEPKSSEQTLNETIQSEKENNEQTLNEITQSEKKNSEDEECINEKNLKQQDKSIASIYIDEFSQKKQNLITSKKNSSEIKKQQINNLVMSNIEETDKIIEKVLKRPDINTEILKKTDPKEVTEINNTQAVNVNTIKEEQIDKNIKEQKIVSYDIELNENQNTNMELILKEDAQSKSTQLIVRGDNISILKKFWFKIVNIFKAKNVIEKIEE